MSLKISFISSFIISASLLLSACGGGSSSSSTAPTARISSASEVIEGTTFIDVNAGTSSDSNGSIESYLWTLEDDGGITSISISDMTSGTTQIVGIPAVIADDITITISLVVTDNEGETSNRESKTIVIKNNVGQVDVSGFDGIWYSPCFNNQFGFSVRQTLNINGSNLTSDISSYTAGTTPSPNCILRSNGLLITSDVIARLSYRADVSASSCLNGRGVNTDINIDSVRSGGDTYSGFSEIDDVLALVTGYRNILPNASTICRTDNGDLIFAGSVYTRGPNTQNVDVIDANIDSEVSWQVGNAVYTGGADASASQTEDNPSNRFGVVVVATNLDTSNGSFSGSSLSITHSLSGSGLYTITDSAISNGDKLVSFNVTVGTASAQATNYVATSASNKVEVIVDSEGKYHFTISTPIFLDKGVEVGGGVPGAPDTIDFTMNNIYDYSE